MTWSFSIVYSSTGHIIQHSHSLWYFITFITCFVNPCQFSFLFILYINIYYHLMGYVITCFLSLFIPCFYTGHTRLPSAPFSSHAIGQRLAAASGQCTTVHNVHWPAMERPLHKQPEFHLSCRPHFDWPGHPLTSLTHFNHFFFTHLFYAIIMVQWGEP